MKAPMELNPNQLSIQLCGSGIHQVNVKLINYSSHMILDYNFHGKQFGHKVDQTGEKK